MFLPVARGFEKAVEIEILQSLVRSMSIEDEFLLDLMGTPLVFAE